VVKMFAPKRVVERADHVVVLYDFMFFVCARHGPRVLRE
jgi:hypothetical protein